MGTIQKNGPIYDEKIELILEGLKAGKTREELAHELGYSSYKSLDIYVRRRNFRWDHNQGTYFPKYTEVIMPKVEDPVTSTKEGLIISLFRSSTDPREIATRMGFANHRELASFMRGKGYVWSGDLENYVIQSTNEDKDPNGHTHLEYCEQKDGVQEEQLQEEQLQEEQLQEIKKYVPLLSFLDKNREQLENLLTVNPTSLKGFSPKGALPIVKISLNPLLDKILLRFSQEHGLSQREVVEGALVEYFLRHSFQKEDDKAF